MPRMEMDGRHYEVDLAEVSAFQEISMGSDEVKPANLQTSLRKRL